MVRVVAMSLLVLVLVLGVALSVLGGCTIGGRAFGSPSDGATSAPPSPVASETGGPVPTTAGPQSPLPTPPPPSPASPGITPPPTASLASPLLTALPKPSSTPSSTATPKSAEQPPAARLSVNGKGSHVATLGSYTFNGAGSDSPWLPARGLPAVEAPRGATLAIRLVDDAAIGIWTVWIAPASDGVGATRHGLASSADPGPRARLEIRGPRPGSWVLMAELTYADGSGSGAYYWHLEVR